MATLILGPLLRYVGETAATVWVETDAACEVILTTTHAPADTPGGMLAEGGGGDRDGPRATSPTFHVGGHHYGLVVLRGLAPGVTYRYQVLVDGAQVWPEPGSPQPPSTIRTIDPAARLRVAFGSCRRALPHIPPYTYSRRRHRHGYGVDALAALSARLPTVPRSEWPHLLLLLGDQVYADELSPQARRFVGGRRDPRGPVSGYRDPRQEPDRGVADFEEYTYLYREAWKPPLVRWLLSTVPIAMIFDDHDVHDDWNTSAAWLRTMRATGWWHERITGGLVSYWLYQHLGNLTPDELEGDQLLAQVRGAADGMGLLRDFADRADESLTHGGVRFSYARDMGRTRLLMIDTRAARVLVPGQRDMLDATQWTWLERQMTGDVDHLLLGTSLPFLLPPAIHDLERWNERVAAGAWGRLPARAGESIRQAADLEHWAAFGAGFDAMARMITEVATGRRGPAPASVVLLSGDVHHAYLAEADLPAGQPARSRVYQAVCSPLRNPVQRVVEWGNRFAATRAARAAASALARRAGATPPSIRWSVTSGPFFDNQIGTLELDGRAAAIRLDRAVALDGDHALEKVAEGPLTVAPSPSGRDLDLEGDHLEGDDSSGRDHDQPRP